MQKSRHFQKVFPFMLGATILFLCGVVSAGEEQHHAEGALLNTYHGVEAKMGKNSFGFPFYLESSEQQGKVSVDVYGIIDHPFSTFLNELKAPGSWCDIASLHPSVKACKYKDPPGTLLMTLYTSRNGYKSPEDIYQFDFHYRDIERRQGYLDVLLSADEGPFSTKGHKMRFEAMPLDTGKTFVHLSYTYSCGFLVRFAGKIYSAVSGDGKIGFTASGTDCNGNPVYVSGARGAIERHAVRYYFAIRTFMDTLRYPEENRFSMRINKWYDLSDQFRNQLYEMEKRDYVAFKTEEHKNQTIRARILTYQLQ